MDDRIDSFDIGEFEEKPSAPFSTAWSTRVAPKTRSRRTYGRRGSDSVVNHRTAKNSSLLESKERKKNRNVVDEDQEEDAGLEDTEQFARASSPYNTSFNGFLESPLPPPRRLKKWKTISGESPVNGKPNLPPKLMRSQSVSALMPNRRSSRQDYENFNPNFVGHSILEENTSPKRSAVMEADKKGRKKSRPTNHSFMQNNNFGALRTGNSDGNNTRGKLPALASDSFSDLARNYGEVEPSWTTSSTSSYPSSKDSNEDFHRRRSFSADLFSPPSFSFPDETMDGSESPTTSTSSTRKRGVHKSQFLIDESPVLRSRSRILSPVPVRTPDLSLSFMESTDLNHRPGSKLMNISFSASKNDKKVARAELDVTMSDDDLYVSGDSDISVDSEDEIMATNSSMAFHGIKQPSSTRSTRIFEPEKATVDDILKYMPSHEDIEFLSTSLQQNLEGQRGCRSCNIAPPVTWAAKRRDAFFQATRTLGFTFRAGGGSVSYIQIPKTRGSALLSLLNSTLAAYDEGKGRQRLLDTEAITAPKQFVFPSAIKKEGQLTQGRRSSPKE